jgi:hypothetical protein
VVVVEEEVVAEEVAVAVVGEGVGVEAEVWGLGLAQVQALAQGLVL